MPYSAPTKSQCKSCSFEYCITYIREQSKKMKDRDTQYRLSQAKAMACTFDGWIPGASSSPGSTVPLESYLEQLEANAIAAGKIIESQDPKFFGKTEKAFFLTEAQLAKVRGDVFEAVVRAILWNCCVKESKRTSGPKIRFPIAAVTLGDNYDLRKLFVPKAADQLTKYIDKLKVRGVSLSYSTPDLVGIDISGLDPETRAHFTKMVPNLSLNNQSKLTNARTLIEGKVKPEDVVFASGIKTSLRSDRMYQFLFEANAWKFIWRHVFEVDACPYHTIMSQSFGADPEKLRSVDFSSPGGPTQAKRAIDSVTQIRTPADVEAWFETATKGLRE